MSKPLLRRPTAIGLAFLAAAQNAGIDASPAALPVKREPTWSVTRREKPKHRRNRRRRK